MRTLTMYLPQFHRVPENDEWWGEGFTEWTAVKAAVPLYEGHCQPRIPLNDNYYDLLEKKTFLWQVDLMKKYGIDGQCFYHYYFKNGRKILERPAENLLKWKEVRMPFCFCWANGSWTRTWSKMNGNSWADIFEKKEKQEGSGILLEQAYGREEEWTEHFYYLLPFFKDSRYIKVDDRPVFMIYNPEAIGCLIPMILYWRRLAKKNGLKGLYIIGNNANFSITCLDALLYHMPHKFWNLYSAERLNGVMQIDYDVTWKNCLNTSSIRGMKTYYEGVADCDDTPRRGGIRGVSFKNFSVEKFQYYMEQLYYKSLLLGNEFIFINAWNEWGEGMYLEPDTLRGEECLQAVKSAREKALKHVGPTICEKVSDCTVDRQYKYEQMALCYDKWMTLKEKKQSIDEILHRYGISKVAIYGVASLGRHLIYELRQTEVEISYLIDVSVRENQVDYPMYRPEDELPKVDAVIVTVLGNVENIYSLLNDKLNCRVFSLIELVSD